MKEPVHNQTFRVRFKTLCKKAGLTAKEIASITGLSASTIKQMPNGRVSGFTKQAVVKALNAKLSLREKIDEATLFADLDPPATAPQRSTTKRVRVFSPAGLPDLLTPGVPRAELQKYYRKHAGSELANVLVQRSIDAIEAVAKGDFARQAQLGESIASVAEEFPQIQAVGLYFAGEGYRLKGDLLGGGSESRRCYAEAVDRYHRALQSNPADPRPLRGLARIEEREKRFDKAAINFELADAKTHLLLVEARDGVARFYLKHERLRVVRHKIHCLLDLRVADPANRWNSVHKTNELHSMVVAADSMHREYMDSFADAPEWSQIEWFMGWVFLAKAWGHLGQKEQLYLALLHGLVARRALIRHSNKLDSVESMNLNWWTDVAWEYRGILEPSFVRDIERLRAALSLGHHAQAIAFVDNFVRRLNPTWGNLPTIV